MAFTPQMLASVQGGGTSAPPAFDPNGFSMQTLPTQQAQPSQSSGVGSEITKYANDVGTEAGNEVTSTWQQTPGNIKNDITQGGQRLAAAGQEKNGLVGMAKSTGAILETGANVASDSLKALFAPITAALGGVTKGASDVISDNKTVQNVATSPIVNFLANKGGQLDTAIKNNPRAAQDFSSALNLLMGAGGELTGAPEESINPSDLKGMASDAATSVKGSIANDAEAIQSQLGTSQKAPTDTLSSRIQDATPSYNSKMNLTNIKNANGEMVPRVSGEGVGMNAERPVTTSASEHAAGTELNNIKNYPDNGTALEKGLAVQKANAAEAESMRAGLQAEDKTTPLNTDIQTTKVQNLVQSNLPEDIRAKIGVLSPEDKSMLAGMTEKAGLPAGTNSDIRLPGEKPGAMPTLPKSAAGNYYTKVLEATDAYDGTREGLLNLRQSIDSAYAQEGGKYTYGSPDHNTLQETHTVIRDSLNKELAATTQNTDVQASLKRQSNLYRATDVLRAKSQAESATAYGRLTQKYPSLRMLARTAERQGILLPLRIIEGAAGVAAAGAFLRSAITGK